MIESQKFFVGEHVAVVDANNNLRQAIVIDSSEVADDRIHVLFKDTMKTSAPERTRVAHLEPVAKATKLAPVDCHICGGPRTPHCNAFCR